MLLALGVAASPQAHAHLGNISYADFNVRGNVVALEFKYAAHITPGVALAPGSMATRQRVLALMEPVEAWLEDTTRLSAGGKPCQLAIDNIVGPDSNDDLQVVAFWTCDVPEVRGFHLDFRPLASALDDWQTICSLHLDGQSYSTVLTPGATGWRVGEAGPAEAGNGSADGDAGEGAGSDSSFARFFALGVEHIWTGYDHLLFLLAVLLAGGGIAKLAGIVTSFTVAHSFTLGAAATGFVRLPVEPVEIAIALSIVYVAVENLFERGADRRALVTFGFGLIHGFGFASVLSETALPPSGVLVPLLAFNLGVEAGQLVVVALAVPVLAIGLRSSHARRFKVVLSVLIAAAGALWAVERIGGMVGGG